MISRRKLLKMLSSLPLGGLRLGGLVESGHTHPYRSNTVAPKAERKENTKSIYESVWARPLINARGTVTIIGATRLHPEVQQAMDEATQEYVQLDELMEGVGRRLGELTGAEWGMVSSGASGAITAAIAGVVSGGNPDRIWQIPELTDLKNEVIIPDYSRSAYDAAVRSVGAEIIEVSTLKELKSAIGPQTAMVYVLAGSRSAEGSLSLRNISSLTKPRGIPILADAAAEGLYVPNPHLEQGADLVAYSGGKYLRGPQCAGLLMGRKDLVQAAWIASAPHHGSGRGYKVGREEIMGMLAAVETWFKCDYEGEIQLWTSWLQHIARRLQSVSGVSIEIQQPNKRSNRSPFLNVHWDTEQIPLTGNDVERLLWDGNPRVAVSGAGSFLPFPPNTSSNISINSSQLKAGEEKLIADRVFKVLSNPPNLPKASKSSASKGMSFAFWPVHRMQSSEPAAFDVSGQWDLEIKFAASTANQMFVFEQNENNLDGTHRASMAPANYPVH